MTTVKDNSESRSATRVALLFLLVLTIFKIGYGARLGLAEDEAYYWQWSRHLDLSYYDQGPGIAYLIRFGTLLAGDTPLGIRLGGILLSAAVGWLTFLTARRWFGEQIALWSLGLVSVAPLFAVGSVLATYDTPQMFFWAAALYAFTRTVQENRSGGWYLVGALVGLGALCKMTMFLFAPCALLFLLLAPHQRRWLATPHPYLGFLIALALYTPVLLWNAQHDWLGFRHTFTLGNRTRDAKPLQWVGDYLGGQALALSPLLFLAEIGALAWLLRRRSSRSEGPGEEAAHFAGAFSAPILLFCLVVSLRSKLEINWPVAAHVTGLIAVAAWFVTIRQRSGIGRRAGIAVSVVIAFLMTLVAFFPALLPAAGLRVTSDQAQKLNQTYGWPQIAARVQAARETLAREGKPVFISGINYRVNSVLAFYVPGQPRTQNLFLGSRRNQYWFWTRPQTLVGQNAVLVLDSIDPEALALARRFFASVEEQPPMIVTRPGFSGPARLWHLYLCRDFKGYDPERHTDGY